MKSMTSEWMRAGACVSAILSFLMMPFDAADSAERVYYSIHVKSCESVEDARRQVERLRSNGRTVFWRMNEVPGESVHYKVYLGRYAGADDAVRSWEKLKRGKDVTFFGIHLLRESFPHATGLRGVTARGPGAIRRSLPAAGTDRFADNGDGTVTDRVTKLMWLKNGWRPEFRAATNWWDAVQRIQRLKIAGHDGWRLPTIDEWASLLDTDRQFPALVEPNPFHNMITHMPYWSRTEYTYGRDFTCQNQCPMEAYSVMLYSGSVIHQKKASRGLVMAVRSLDTS